MDFGEVRRGHDDWEYGEHYENDQEGDVGAVSANAQCHGRGGWGHLRRDCPTVAAGKGSKGKGKGKGPAQEQGKGGATGWGESAGKGGKGGPKGSFKCACLICNKAGHRAADCTTKQANAVEEQEQEQEGEEAELGGLWTIGCVEAIEWRTATSCKRWSCTPARLPQSEKAPWPADARAGSCRP